MADPNIVRDWLTLLAGLNGYGIGKEEVQLRLDLLAPALAEEFPVEVFTTDTVRAAAKKHTRYFPGFGELCEVLQPFAQAAREDRRLRIEYSGPTRTESQEPYQPPPAPEWCFNRQPRLMGRREAAELNIHDPIRTVEDQLAILAKASVLETV